MRENVWKYVSAILILLLAASSIAVVLLYMQNSELQNYIPSNVTNTVIVEGSINASCNVTAYKLQLDELQRQLDFLKAQLREQNLPEGNTTIAIVPIFGLIDEYTALSIIPVLRDIAENDSIGGVVLWIESPGGYVGPVREIYATVKKLNLIKPVVAYTGGIAASGGYYIAVGAEEIIADPLAEVGSIGVIYVHYNLQQNYEMNGIKVEVFKTGPYKDMGAEWRGLTEEEKAMITESVDTYFQAFLQAVSSSRGMSLNETKEYATGRTWFAMNVTGSLVDETGDLDYAVKVLGEMLNVTNPRIVIYSGRSSSNFAIFGSTALLLDPRYVDPYLKTG
ncbi:signal peptide peptidase SppA [Thermococcus sp. GR7]|uniref:signal peptide peptidase SppA n=1 Tax=unclassified Thermococcus TaxID=2627626 RepID=UPI001430CFCB|nr:MULTISPECIES: signal peptide peptidase SppA [unclassified Thermococcus]NJE46365.1 signal peptide peptidase SppA [Thermococcus sp. GR7]NJE77716.1 signal peptide peptidase SppA [Thermococcus sp. GR4]NJF23755.1 signal peptide peptidase SppA [Thermococcus sp. GR5]